MADRNIRAATAADLSRIAEIFVFNNRLNFYPIFGDAAYSFGELQVVPLANGLFAEQLPHIAVYDDGVVKGFVWIDGKEIVKLYVDPCFQRQGIGAALLDFSGKQGADFLWALEKNTRAIAFYRRHGFSPTGERTFEEGTTEYLLRLKNISAGHR